MNCLKTKLKHSGHIVGLFSVVLLAGCAGLQQKPAFEKGLQDATQVTAIASVQATIPEANATNTSSVTPPIVLNPVAPVERVPETSLSAAATPAEQPATKPAVPTIKSPTKITVPQASALQPAKKDGFPSVAAKASATPPLDMKSLETRLKDTKAIGVFTKIALKNQVNDLLDQFRAYYQGRLKITLADLRRPYEMLLQKVLALLQDGDPPLAGAIVASREAIWGLLADPVKFATI